MQSVMWWRSTNQDTALHEEGNLPTGGGGGALLLPCDLSGPSPALPHPVLSARMEHWILVTGGFVATFQNHKSSVAFNFDSPR